MSVRMVIVDRIHYGSYHLAASKRIVLLCQANLRCLVGLIIRGPLEDGSSLLEVPCCGSPSGLVEA